MTHCGGCGAPIRYPVIARQSDIEAFKSLINIAEEYLNEHGIPQKILCDIMDRINLGLTINKALGE